MYSEFDRNLKGIDKTIDSYQQMIDAVKGIAIPEDIDLLNINLNILRQIQNKWKEHDIFFARRSYQYFNLPNEWVQDKKARYYATIDINKILDRYHDTIKT